MAPSSSLAALLVAPLLGPGAAEVVQALRDRSGDDVAPDERARALVRLAEHDLFEGTLDSAGRLLLQAGPLLAEADAQLRARLLFARVLIRRTQRREAQEVLDQGLARQVHPTPATRLQHHLVRAELALDEQRAAEAATFLERALGLARGPAAAHDRWHVLVARATTLQLQRSPTLAIPHLEEALTLAEGHGSREHMVAPLASLANLYLEVGTTERAEPLLRRVLSLQELPAPLRPLLHGLLARILLGNGDLTEARHHGLLAAKAGAAARNAGAFTDGTLLVAQAERADGRPEAARETLQAGVEVLLSRKEGQLAQLLQRDLDLLRTSSAR
jgi:tetratricopeptide (TPR) repeat protein